MTIQQLIDADVKRIRKENWEPEEWAEPHINVDGEIDNKILYCCPSGKVYLSVKDCSSDPRNDDNWISADPEPEKGDFELPDNFCESQRNIYGELPSIPFETASNHVILFGPPQYRGKTIMEIARFDYGLKWLDYVVGQEWLYRGTKLMIERYLREPSIKKELEQII
jgi:hypothetical protein